MMKTLVNLCVLIFDAKILIVPIFIVYVFVIIKYNITESVIFNTNIYIFTRSLNFFATFSKLILKIKYCNIAIVRISSTGIDKRFSKC